MKARALSFCLSNYLVLSYTLFKHGGFAELLWLKVSVNLILPCVCLILFKNHLSWLSITTSGSSKSYQFISCCVKYSGPFAKVESTTAINRMCGKGLKGRGFILNTYSPFPHTSQACKMLHIVAWRFDKPFPACWAMCPIRNEVSFLL